MLAYKLDPDDVARLVKRLGRVKAVDALRDPMERSTARLQKDLADYPPPSHRPQPAKSRKQQIKQIMLAKEGKIPYRRTGKLGQRWTTEIEETARTYQGRVGNTTVYGPLVQSASDQAGYHRGTWQTDEMVIDRNRKDIVDDFADAIDDALR